MLCLLRCTACSRVVTAWRRAWISALWRCIVSSSPEVAAASSEPQWLYSCIPCRLMIAGPEITSLGFVCAVQKLALESFHVHDPCQREAVRNQMRVVPEPFRQFTTLDVVSNGVPGLSVVLRVPKHDCLLAAVTSGDRCC